MQQPLRTAQQQYAGVLCNRSLQCAAVVMSSVQEGAGAGARAGARAPASQVHQVEGPLQALARGLMAACDVQREHRVASGGHGVHGCGLHCSGCCSPLHQGLGCCGAADWQPACPLNHSLTAYTAVTTILVIIDVGRLMIDAFWFLTQCFVHKITDICGLMIGTFIIMDEQVVFESEGMRDTAQAATHCLRRLNHK